MIKINRTSPGPNVLTAGGDQEVIDACAHYASENYWAAKKRKSFDHDLYADVEVRTALEELFNKKCAYCESFVVTIAPIDKEHFRPKNEVKIDGVSYKPGYYWLAAKWSNLFLSCPRCNRANSYTINGEKIILGKAEHFPMSDPSKLARNPMDVSDEDFRLLINPCTENPEEYFYFDESGSILPKPNLSQKKSDMALASMKYYALIRPELVKKRESHFLKVTRRINNVESRLRDFLQYGTSVRKEELEEALQELNELQDEQESEYIAITRQLVNDSYIKIEEALSSLETGD